MVDASPPHLLAEIILVDDGSDAWWLGEELEHYVATELPVGLVKIVRTGSRKVWLLLLLLLLCTACGRVLCGLCVSVGGCA